MEYLNRYDIFIKEVVDTRTTTLDILRKCEFANKIHTTTEEQIFERAKRREEFYKKQVEAKKINQKK